MGCCWVDRRRVPGITSQSPASPCTFLSLLQSSMVFDLLYSKISFDLLDEDTMQAIVTMSNWQLYRHIQAPGWIMGWTWATKKEVIWNMVGAETREQGDCSKFTGNLPHCCKRTPEVIDLLPGVPYNQQTANCCRGGVLSSYMQDPKTSVASFQVIVGNTGNKNTTIKLPQNFTIMTPGPGYTCSSAKVVPKTKFLSPSGRRITEAFSKYLKHFNMIVSKAQFRAPIKKICVMSYITQTVVWIVRTTCLIGYNN